VDGVKVIQWLVVVEDVKQKDTMVIQHGMDGVGVVILCESNVVFVQVVTEIFPTEQGAARIAIAVVIGVVVEAGSVSPGIVMENAIDRNFIRKKMI